MQTDNPNSNHIDPDRLERAIIAIERLSIEAQENCERQSVNDEARFNREKKVMSGIVLQPWLITLIISISVQLIGLAFLSGTIVTRLEAIQSRVDRIEKQIDTQERLRSPAGYTSPPVGGFGRPLGLGLAWMHFYR